MLRKEVQAPASTPTQNPYQEFFNAVESVGPRVYRLKTNNHSEKINFVVMGCHGSGNDNQREVAKLMKKVALKPDFILMLGDNVYDHGASSPDDPQFKKYFYDIYGDTNTPCFVLLGNHDENRCKAARIESYIHTVSQGKGVGINQVAHTYMKSKARHPSKIKSDHTITSDGLSFHAMTRDEEVTPEQKIKRFKQDILDLDELDKWNMPYYYYSLIAEDVQIFCLNTNTYAKDFIEYHKNPHLYVNEEDKKKNQAAWFESEYKKAKAARRKIIVAQHHPLYTSGKRASKDHSDTIDYLNPDDVEYLKAKLGCKSELHHDLLRSIYTAQEIDPDVVLVAHDHCMQFYNEKTKEKPQGLCQVTAGGGGGDLQNRMYIVGHDNVGSYLKKYGCSLLSFEKQQPQEIQIEIFSTEGHHLKFTNQSNYPIEPAIRYESNIEESLKIKATKVIQIVQLKKLREVILKSVDEYFHLLMASTFIREKQSQLATTSFFRSVYSNIARPVFALTNYLTKGDSLPTEIDVIHNITACLNNIDLTHPTSIIAKLNQHMNEFKIKNTTDWTHPFAAILGIINTSSSNHSSTTNQELNQTIKNNVANYLKQANLGDANILAGNLIEYGKLLNNDQHPFYTLVNKNLIAHFERDFDSFYHQYCPDINPVIAPAPR